MKDKNVTLFWRLLCGALAVVSFVFGMLMHLYPANKPASLDTIPPFSGEPYIVLNDNIPEFLENEVSARSFEYYSDLDMYNRCGYALACVGKEIMPTEERGSIGQIKPSGWQTIKYDFIDGKYLYNRCHLIGYQLTGENANACNLITGTRYLNIEGMLPFENMVADYIMETGNHVMYRVTPVFYESEMVARGVRMEGWSVEDNGAGICFHIYAYNNQPGVIIDYATGESCLDTGESTDFTKTQVSYILNTESKKFHLPTCGQGKNINQEHMEYYSGHHWTLIAAGYSAAGCCAP